MGGLPGWQEGAKSSGLFADDYPDLSFSGGNRGDMADYYGNLAKKNPYAAHKMTDPYMEDWKKQSGAMQMQDRGNLVDLYRRMEEQARGGVTPQQQQMQQGMMNAAQMQQTAAMGQVGGARARAAAMGGLTQQAGIQGAQNTQAMNMQKSADQISGRNQMMQVASAMRAQDLQAQGLTAEDAQRQADMETRARGLNIQSELGYRGLQSGSLQNDYQAMIDAYRRKRQKDAADAAKTQSDIAAGTSAAASAVSAGAASF